MRNRDTWVIGASVSVKWYLRDEELAFPADRVRHQVEEYARLGLTPQAEPDWLVADGAELALDLRIGIYDALYIALAERIDGIFVTADRKVYDAVSGKLESVHWLGDAQP